MSGHLLSHLQRIPATEDQGADRLRPDCGSPGSGEGGCRAVVATALMVKEASKLTLGQPPQCIHLTRCKQSWKLKGIGG